MSTNEICTDCGGFLDAISGDCPACLLALGRLESYPDDVPPADAIDQTRSFQALPEFEMKEVLGQGGSAVVYRALRRGFGEEVAIKILRQDRPLDSVIGRRFFEEVDAVESLEHPNIVKLLGHDLRGVTAFLVMEYVKGESLREKMLAGPVGPLESCRIVGQMAAALGHAHARGVLHRDLKPENVLVDEKGTARLTDFGLALSLDRQGSASSYAIGTPHYMAPEQLSGHDRVDERSDVYALGVLLYELLTGELPIGRFRPASGAGALPRSVDQLIDSALEADPERRPQTAEAFRAQLAAIETELTERAALGALTLHDADARESVEVDELVGDYPTPISRLSDSGGLDLVLAILGGAMLVVFLFVFIFSGDEPDRIKQELEALERFAPPAEVSFLKAAMTVAEGSRNDVIEVVSRGVSFPRDRGPKAALLIRMAEKRDDPVIGEIVRKAFEHVAGDHLEQRPDEDR